MKMKKTFKFFMMAAIVAAGFTACSSSEEDPANKPKGDDTFASITVKDGTPSAYASTGEAQVLSVEGVNTPLYLKAYVYQASTGAYETKETSGFSSDASNPGGFISKAIKVSAEQKYVYVIYDINTVITGAIESSANRVDFEKAEISAGFAASTQADQVNYLPVTPATSINPTKLVGTKAVPDQFMMGVLWPTVVTAQAGGTSTAGKPLAEGQMGIGRLASKVILSSINPLKGTADGLPGTFSDYKYRLCSVPIKMFLIGQYTGGTGQPGTGGTGHLVTSAVHNDTWYTGADDNKATGLQNLNYVTYPWDLGKTVTANPTTGVGSNPYSNTSNSNLLFAVENTTAPDKNPGANGTLDALYYGNTTYMQLTCKYTPAASEVLNNDGTPGGTVGATYYIYKYKGKRCIFVNPFEQLDQAVQDDIELTDPVNGTVEEETYVNGMMTYSFAIQEANETGAEKQYRILRNHVYDLSVTKISQYGSGSNKPIKPGEPIPQDTYLTVQVKVLPWSKVTQNVPL